MMVQWTLNILLSNYVASLKERQRRVHYQSQQCPSCRQFTIAWEQAFDLAPVVQKLDRTTCTCVSTGYITIQWISNTKTNCVIHWIVIYPVDSAIHLLNNWSLGDIVRYHARASGTRDETYRLFFTRSRVPARYGEADLAALGRHNGFDWENNEQTKTTMEPSQKTKDLQPIWVLQFYCMKSLLAG